MEWTQWVQPVVSLLAGLAATIPLVIKLVEYVRKAIMEKNWPQVVKLVMTYMERAETMFDTGADRKEWVMAMVKASADSINYEVDMDAVSDLIEALCDMSKIVNVEEAGDSTETVETAEAAEAA